MALSLDPIPQSDPLIDSEDRMNDRWYRWLSQFVTRVTAGSQRVGNAVHRTNQNAAIAATAAYTTTQEGIDFRVSWYVRVTTAAGVSSSVAVTITWNDNGNTCSKTFAALTGNTVTTADGDSVTVRARSGTDIKYSTSYASNAASAMQYTLDVVVESLT